MRFISKMAFAGVSLVTLATSVHAQAQAGAGAQAVASNDIVVTARRRSEKSQDVPLVVNAVSGETLQKLSIQKFTDITSVVPGLSLVPNANGIGAATSLRGINHDVNVSGNNGTVQFYLDDAPIGSDDVYQAMFDVTGVTVERGPQGTLRGRAAPSGAIAITTHTPDLQRAGGFAEVTGGSDNKVNGSFGINVPVIENVLAFRVAGLYDHSKGDQVTSVNNPSQAYNDTQAYRWSVAFQPTSWLKAGAYYQKINHDYQGYDQEQSFSITDPTVAVSANAPNYGTISASDRKSVEFTPRIGSQDFEYYHWNAQVSFAGQNLIYVGTHTTDSYRVTTPEDNAGFFPTLSNNLQKTSTDVDGETHEVRLQNQNRVAGIFDYVVGYFNQTGAPTTSLTQGSVIQLCVISCSIAKLGGPSTTQVSISLPQTHTSEESYFGNLTAHFGKFELSGGLRNIALKDPGQNLYVNGGLISPATPNNINKTIYTVSAKYRITPDLMVYVASGSSLRPGAHAIGDFSAIYSANEQAHTVTAPETSKSYEIGFKSDWMQKKLTLNMTYYHQEYTNYPFRAAGAGIYYLHYASPTAAADVSSFNFISAVPVKVDGVEMEAIVRPSHNFNLQGLLNYSKSTIGNASLACNLLASNVVPTVAQLQAAFAAAGYPTEHLGVCNGGGQSATFQPKWSGSLNGEYSHPLGSGRLEGFVRGLVTWHGSSANDPNNPYDDTPAYALMNGYIGVRDSKGGWSLTLYGKNLANTTKLTTLNASPYTLSQTNVFLLPPTFSPGGTSSTTNVGRYGGVSVTPPQEFGVTFRVAFGSR